MSEQPIEVFDQLLQRLEKLLQQNSTGTWLVATTANTSVRFALQQGQLTHCTYYRLHGDQALQALVRDAPQGRATFLANARYPFKAQALLEHEAALPILFKINNQDLELTKAKTHPSGFTEEQLLQLFGRFYFE